MFFNILKFKETIFFHSVIYNSWEIKVYLTEFLFFYLSKFISTYSHEYLLRFLETSKKSFKIKNKKRFGKYRIFFNSCNEYQHFFPVHYCCCRKTKVPSSWWVSGGRRKCAWTHARVGIKWKMLILFSFLENVSSVLFFPPFFWDSSNELQKHIWPQTHDPPPISTRPDSPDLSSFVFGQKNGHRNGKKKKRLYSTSLALPLTPVQCRLFLVACCRHLRSTHCQSSRVPLPLY